MSTHVKVVAVIFIVFGAMGVIGAFFSTLLFGTLAGIVGTSQESGAGVGSAVLGVTGVALSALLLIFSVPSIICGMGLLKFRRWARILGIVLAIFSLIHVPWGTVFGAYALWVLFSKETEL
ncbi:MAG: hypothetical protein ABI652_04415, partial [Acidobacteriota bacterium]